MAKSPPSSDSEKNIHPVTDKPEDGLPRVQYIYLYYLPGARHFIPIEDSTSPPSVNVLDGRDNFTKRHNIDLTPRGTTGERILELKYKKLLKSALC